MTKDLKPFARGFRSTDYAKLLDVSKWDVGDEPVEDPDDNTADKGSGSGEDRAVAIPWTNTLRMMVPADNEREMTVAAAFVSREEFLHGKWTVAIINTLAHLFLAADDALVRLVLSPESEYGSSDYLQAVAACEKTIDTILAPMAPFVEAVDKFQLLTVIDEGFVSGVESTYEEAQGIDTDDAFRKYFYKVLDAEEKIATGKRVVPGAKRYVNPQYFHALADIVVTWESVETSDPFAENAVDRAQARAVAETVARVTLDVPHPIEPLGSERFSWFDPLTMPEVDLDPLTAQELVETERYPMTKDDFSDYLGKYPEVDESEAEGAEEALAPREWPFEYTYEEAKSDWVARVFVKVRKALEDLREERGVELAEDSEQLRELLVERVHGENTTNTVTMFDFPTALIDIPKQQQTPPHDEDVMSAQGSPLSKILLESFEHHGSFGAVVYNLTEEETKFELNWNAKGEQVNEEEYRHIPETDLIPDDISSANDGIVYEDHWRYYFFWDGLREHLRDSYRTALIKNLALKFDTTDDLKQELKRTKGQMEQNFSASSSPQAPGVSERAGMASKDFEKFGWEEAEETLEELKPDVKIREMLERYPTDILARLATGFDREPDIKRYIEDVDCPLCSIHSGRCGRENSCAWVETREQFDSRLPEMVSQFVVLD